MSKQKPLKQVLFGNSHKYLWLVLLFVATILLNTFITLSQKTEAATSSNINFQARLLQSSGAIVSDGYYNVQFKLYTVSSGGTAAWTETYYDSNGATAGNDNRARVVNGYLTVNLGSQTAFPSSMNWDQEHWMTMNIGGITQTATPTWDGEMSPRLKLTGVPYAFSAGKLQQTNGANSSTLGFASQTAANSILLPDASGTVCLQNATACGFAASSGSTSYIHNGTSLQSAANFNIQAANSGTAGTIGGIIRGASGGQTVDLLQLQGSGGTVLTHFDSSGRLAVGTSAAPVSVLVVGTDTTAASGGITFGTDTNLYRSGANTLQSDDSLVLNGSGSNLTVGGTLGVTGLGTFNGGLSVATGYTFTNASSTLLTAISITDKPTGGNIGTAATTVDVATSFNVNQTTAGQTLTLPNPTATTAGRLVYVNNIGTASFTLYGVTVAAGSSVAYIWNGTAWATSTVGSGVNAIGTIDSQTKSANGAVIVGSTLYLQNADATNVGLMSTGAQTFSGDKTFKNSTNSTTAFQIQNAAGANLLTADTSTTSNLITNGDIEGNGTGGWTAKGSSTLSQSSSQQWQGNNSLSVATTTAAADGAKYDYTLTASTQYTFSFYAKVASGSITDVNIGRQDVSGTDIDCLAAQTVTTSWTRFSCSFTTGATITSSNLYVKKTGTAAETFFIDGIQLQTGATATAFDMGGRLQLAGIVNSPITFQNKSNSTAAFQIQNAAGTSNLLVADTANTRLGIGVATPSATLHVVGSSTLEGGIINLNASSNFATNINTGTSTGAIAIGNSSTSGFTLESGTATTNLFNGATAHTIQLATGAAAQSLTMGSTNTTSSTTIQGGTGGISLLPSGSSNTGITIRPTVANSTELFRIRNLANDSNYFVVDGVNSRIGINMSVAPQAALDIGTGGLRIAGNLTTFTTPVGSSVSTYINIPAVDPGNFGQLLALGLPSTASTSARAISIFDARTAAHQPTIGVFSPDENNLVGFSWEGSNTTSYLKATGGNIGIRSNTTDIASFLSTGNTSLAGDLEVVGADITTTSIGTATLFNTNAVTLNIGGAATAAGGGINLAGGSASTGCSLDGSNGNLSCSGTILGSNTNLQGTYNADTDSADAAIVLTAADGGLLFQNPSSGGIASGAILKVDQLATGAVEGLRVESAGTGNLLTIRDTTATAQDVLTILDGGAATFRNQTDSTAAFQIQNAAAASLLTVDTAGSNITLLGNNSGALSSWITNGSTGLTNRREHASVTANGYIYIIGGSSGGTTSPTNTAYYGKANADGSVGTWNTTSTLPAARADGRAVYANGYIYYIGGEDSAPAVQSSVYYAKVNSDGTLGAWDTSSATGLGARSAHTVAVTNGYIYVMGGEETVGGSGTTTVYYAKLNADGSVGTWATTAALAANRTRAASVTANGYIYIIGGSTGAARANTIYYAKPALNGTISAWTSQASNLLPAATDMLSAGVANGYIYAIGGKTDTATEDDVYYAPFNADGSTGTWTATTVLPGAREQGSAVVLNGYIYQLEGSTGAALQSTVYYTSTSRLKVGGSLDLVSYSGENLSEGGTGGSLTAGNTNIVGTLQVQDMASFMQGVSIDKELTVGGSALFKNTTNSVDALQIQNSSGTKLFQVNSVSSRVYIGNSSADSIGTVLVLDTKNTSGDPTGIEGAMYYNSNMGRMRCYFDGQWRFCNDPVGLTWGINMEEDFLTMDTGSIRYGVYNWQHSFSGTASSVGTAEQDVAYRPGQILFATGTTTTGYAALGSWMSPNGTFNGEPILIGGGEEIEFAVNIPTLADATNDYDLRLGLCDNWPTDCTDGVYVEYDLGTSANWRYATANNSTRTKSTSSTAVTTGWHRFKIVVNPAGNSIEFFVDGVSMGSAITTNIPSATGRGTQPAFVMVKQAGTTNRTMKVDYFQYRQTLTTQR